MRGRRRQGRQRRGHDTACTRQATDPFDEYAQDQISKLLARTKRLINLVGIDEHRIRAFVNATREVRDLHPLATLPFVGSVPGSRNRCILARALDGEVALDIDAPWKLHLRVDRPAVAHDIGRAADCAAPDAGIPHVVLPDFIGVLGLAFDFGLIGPADLERQYPDQLRFWDRPANAPLELRRAGHFSTRVRWFPSDDYWCSDGGWWDVPDPRASVNFFLTGATVELSGPPRDA